MKNTISKFIIVLHYYITYSIENTNNINDSIFFSGIQSSDNLAIWIGPLTHGATFYYAKSSNLASSVANDITTTTGGY